MASVITDTETRMELYGEHDLRPTRRVVRSIAERLPFDTRQVADITLAVTEACINGIRYGSTRPERPLVSVAAHPHDDHLHIEVVDYGEGFVPSKPAMPEPYAERGRGLPLMFALMDRVAINSDEDGTRVQLVKYFVR